MNIIESKKKLSKLLNIHTCFIFNISLLVN